MRWLTIPLHRDSDVVPARSRLRAWADVLGLDPLLRTRIITLGSELAAWAARSSDGSIEFGWDRAREKPFCAIEAPAALPLPSAPLARESMIPGEGVSDLEVASGVEGDRRRIELAVATLSEADIVQRAVADAVEATAHELLKEQNLEMARMLGTLRDRESELARALEEARRSANEATANALRVSELSKRKDELLAIASHDIRSPIAAARGALELLEPTLGPLSDDQRHLLAVARRASDAVVHLLGNLLSTALIEGSAESEGKDGNGGNEGKDGNEGNDANEGNDEGDDDEVIVDIAQATRDVVDMLAIQARQKGVEIAVDIPAAPLPIRGDLMWTRQVVTNLLNNAVKFTPKGGHVSIRLQLAREGGGEGEREVVLTVEDDGVGIPPDKVDRVFAKLNKIRARGTAGERGTGIGMYVTKRLIERMGGAVSVAARPGGGTRFEVRLPSSTVAAETKATTDGQARAPAQHVL